MLYKFHALYLLCAVMTLTLLSGCVANKADFLASKEFWLGEESQPVTMADGDEAIPYPYMGYYYMEHDDPFENPPGPIEEDDWRRHSDQLNEKAPRL